MSSSDEDGGESRRPLTLQLLQQLDQPKPCLPKTDKQNPNPSDGGGGEDDNPFELPKPPQPNPSLNPPEKQKPRKFRPTPVPPRLTRTHPMSQQEQKTMSERAKSFKWKQWTPKVTPSVATLTSLPHLLCSMHGELLKAKVYPQDDIYSQLPTTLTHEKPFNLKEEAAYLLYGKRYPGEKPGTTNRKFLVDGIKGRWRNQGSMDVVAGPNGQVCGMHFTMVLECFRVDGWTPTDWSADEFISVTSEAGESSLVVLRCKGDEWNLVEKEVHLAEDQLLLCYQQLVSAEYEGLDSEIGRLNSLVFESEVRLGCALTQFEHTRNAVKSLQELMFGFKGKAIEESVNLDLGLGVGGYCSEPAVRIGSYYLGLKKKKMDEKSRKQKLNTPTAAVGQNILEPDVVTDPLVSTPVGSTFLSSLLEK